MSPVDVRLDDLDFEKGGGFVTVVAQDAATGRVLMTARADREAVARTLETGEMHYHSRTRGLWHKGATSGHRQRVMALVADCDGDALLASVSTAGPACHTGAPSCFPGDTTTGPLGALDRVIASRAAAMERDPDTAASYTRRLLRDRNLRLKKVGEEATEFCVACADGDTESAVAEAADLLFHVLVALRAVGAGLDQVTACLADRREVPRR